MHRVAFVCSGNVCRSPMAQAIFAAEAARRGLSVDVTSAGVLDLGGEPVASEARWVCDQNGSPMPKVLATHIADVDLAGMMRVFVMEHDHVRRVLERTALSPARVSLIGTFDPQHRGDEIADPVGQDQAAFERCYLRLRDCIVHYLDTTEDFG